MVDWLLDEIKFIFNRILPSLFVRVIKLTKRVLLFKSTPKRSHKIILKIFESFVYWAHNIAEVKAFIFLQLSYHAFNISRHFYKLFKWETVLFFVYKESNLQLFDRRIIYFILILQQHNLISFTGLAFYYFFLARLLFLDYMLFLHWLLLLLNFLLLWNFVIFKLFHLLL